MNCPKCKKELPAEAKFCIHCGVDVKTGKRRRSWLGRLWSWLARTIGIMLGLLIVASIALSALPGGWQLYQIYFNPEATKKGLTQSSNITFNYEVSRPAEAKQGEFNFQVLVKNDNDQDIPITRAKFIGLKDTTVISGDQGFKREEISFGENVLVYEPALVFKAKQVTTCNLVLKTTAKADFAAQLVYLNLAQNITAGLTFAVQVQEIIK